MRNRRGTLKTCSMLALLVASSTFAGGALAQGGNLRIAIPANQEPASLDGQVDPYQSTWLFNSFVDGPARRARPDGKIRAGARDELGSVP